ncbi:hypothetical protein [Leptospira levettii]|uniref:Uncharacterized protein n=1 Tax=Leptospira levettii TaxID=2023178 RepID=A0ABY2MH53_9LEPT|nr:hypothetical protein [Leptospira levettii]TGL66508.1 hypothetical protein EHQ60_18665 [Leptospira levettii]
MKIKRKISEIDSFVELTDNLFSKELKEHSTTDLKEFRSVVWKLNKEFNAEKIFEMLSIELSQRDTSRKFLISIIISLFTLFVSLIFKAI